MKMLAVARFALLSAALSGTAQAKLENYVNDGSFETARPAVVSGAYCYLNAQDHECGPDVVWTGSAPLLQAANDAVGNPASPYGQVLAGVQSDGHIEQMLRLPAAGLYTLTWVDAGPGGPGPADGADAQGYRVLFDGVMLDTEQVSHGAGWREHTVTFTAQGSGLLRFQGVGNNGGATAFIDNVAVTAPVPEPHSYTTLMIGLSLLAFTARGKRSKKFIT